MTKTEYKKLAVGDIVSPMRGKNKNKEARVTYIHDVIDDDGYNEVIIFGEYLYPESDKSFNINYKHLRRH